MAKVYNRLMFCFGMERVGLCLGILGEGVPNLNFLEEGVMKLNFLRESSKNHHSDFITLKNLKGGIK